MESVIFGLEFLRRTLSKLGPYALVEIVLPGGTLFALLLYMYRRQSGQKRSAGRRSGAPSNDHRAGRLLDRARAPGLSI